MRRRDVLYGLAAGPALAGTAWAAPPSVDEEASVAGLVRRRARKLASAPYSPPSKALPAALSDLTYDAYRHVNFRGDKAIWRDLGLPFQVQMFHRGGLYRDTVEVFEVVDGVVQPIAYDTGMFTGLDGLGPFSPDLGFAGLRIHAPLNRSDIFDEFAVFQGASYFRAVGRGDGYGLSGRGLGIGVGEDIEEFPAFRSLYIERPELDATSITLHALLDGPSVAGAWSCTLTPGDSTRMEVSLSLFPRVRLANAGIAPLTSMYLFGAERPGRFDDFRPQVHDSDGLLIDNGRGERLWRPLAHPIRRQTSAFLDDGPKGFGLMQRERRFEGYQDLEANYHMRPSAWVEPLEGFGAGDVRLVELSARGEGEDNIGASWRPAVPLDTGLEHRFRYRIHWSGDPAPPSGLARVVRSGSSAVESSGRRLFVIDFSAGNAEALADADADISASHGLISHINVQPDTYVGGARLSFELDPVQAVVIELRAALRTKGSPVSEVWTYRWLT